MNCHMNRLNAPFQTHHVYLCLTLSHFAISLLVPRPLSSLQNQQKCFVFFATKEQHMFFEQRRQWLARNTPTIFWLMNIFRSETNLKELMKILTSTAIKFGLGDGFFWCTMYHNVSCEVLNRIQCQEGWVKNRKCRSFFPRMMQTHKKSQRDGGQYEATQ